MCRKSSHRCMIFYTKELRSFVHRFVIFSSSSSSSSICSAFSTHTHTYLPLLLRKFVISLSFICWALISLGGVVYLCNIYMFQESTFNPVHWYQRKFIFYNLSWGLQSPLDFEHSNKKKYVEKTTPSKNDDVVPFYFQIEIFNTHIKQFF